jgi:hypothetical protein
MILFISGEALQLNGHKIFICYKLSNVCLQCLTWWTQSNKELLHTQLSISVPRFTFYTGAFYYMLGNIQPMYRSTTRTIQLLAVAKTMDLKKHGIDALLTPITEKINQLSKVFSF